MAFATLFTHYKDTLDTDEKRPSTSEKTNKQPKKKGKKRQHHQPKYVDKFPKEFWRILKDIPLENLESKLQTYFSICSNDYTTLNARRNDYTTLNALRNEIAHGKKGY